MFLITDYDDGAYSYQDYWQGRDYEHQAELHAMRSLLRSGSDGWIADLGCGFGRLAPAYLASARPVVFVDHSLKLLDQAQARYGPPHSTRLYVAANLNHLPFRTGSIDTTLLIRVMHHLPSYNRVLREVSRIAQREWILDVPQKLHAVAQARGLLRGQWRTLRDPAPVTLSRKATQVFLNYHPQSIEHQVTKLGWLIRDVRSTSNLRSPWLKQRVGLNRLVSLESWLQSRLASVRFGPNLWYALSRLESIDTPAPVESEVLACPQCQGSLERLEEDTMVCWGCSQRFIRHKRIWDLRWPRPDSELTASEGVDAKFWSRWPSNSDPGPRTYTSHSTTLSQE